MTVAPQPADHGRHASTCRGRGCLTATRATSNAKYSKPCRPTEGRSPKPYKPQNTSTKPPRDVEAADRELDQYITNPQLLTMLGEDRFLLAASTHASAHSTTPAPASQNLRQHEELTAELTDGNLLDAWPTLTTQEKRPSTRPP